MTKDWITKDGINLSHIAAEKEGTGMATTKGNPELTPAEKIAARKAEIAAAQASQPVVEGPAQKAGRVNRIEIEGTLRDPDFHFTTNGKGIWSGRLEVAQRPNKDGSWPPAMVLWLEMWQNEGENDIEFAAAINLLDKTRVIAEGKLRMDTWNDKDGHQRTSWRIGLQEITAVNGQK